jgi:hypothetical protein
MGFGGAIVAQSRRGRESEDGREETKAFLLQGGLLQQVSGFLRIQKINICLKKKKLART